MEEFLFKNLMNFKFFLFYIWFASFFVFLDWVFSAEFQHKRVKLAPADTHDLIIWFMSTDPRIRGVSSVWCWPGGSHGPCPACFCCHLWLLQPRSSNAINRTFIDNTCEWWTLTNAIQCVTQKRDVAYSIQLLGKAQWSPSCVMGMCVNVQKVRETEVIIL